METTENTNWRGGAMECRTLPSKVMMDKLLDSGIELMDLTDALSKCDYIWTDFERYRLDSALEVISKIISFAVGRAKSTIGNNS